jgi:hypothetical protein
LFMKAKSAHWKIGDSLSKRPRESPFIILILSKLFIKNKVADSQNVWRHFAKMAT